MIKKQFKDLQLSSLGFGAMRLTGKSSGWGGPIHESAKAMIDYSMEHGINFYDTAYFYHDGESERFLGKELAGYPRDSWYLSSKFPGNLMSVKDGKLEVSGKSFSKPVDIFDLQIDRCNVNYFDFYMLHNVSESTFDTYTDDNLGIIDCLLEQKAKGYIRHLGFSTHGRAETIDRFMRYLKQRNCNDFEFVLMQVNYLDWTLQNAEKKHAVATEHGLSVFVMEPLRGGKLAGLGKEADTLFKSARPNDSHAAWAFRYLQMLDNTPVIVSGMSTFDQLKENVELFKKHDPLSKEDAAILQKAKETITELVPCTTCGYCVSSCPVNLDIPTLMTMYNEAGYEMAWFLSSAIKSLKEHEKPGACTSCGACSPLCPQNIDIPKAMEEFNEIIVRELKK